MSTPPNVRPVGPTDETARYNIWKTDHVPLLYDWISSRWLKWPHAAVRWGSRGRNGASAFSTRALYLGERTGTTGPDANTLLHFEARVIDEHASKLNDIASPWLDEPVVTNRSHSISTPEFSLKKRIIHPGEVNKIRMVAPDVVVTNADSPELYVWDFKSQRHRERDELSTNTNTPTCTLSGHTNIAEHALSVFSTNGPYQPSDDVWIASGGVDREILVWNLRDYESNGRIIKPSKRLGPENQSNHHQHTVEDLSFNRVNRNLLASVGRDQMLIIWDFRQGSRAGTVVRGAHLGDINSCDFSGPNDHLIVTGSNDELVKVWDKRYLMNQNGVAIPYHTFSGHSGKVNVVAWNRYLPNVCASGGADGHVRLWDRSKDSNSPVENPMMTNAALLFRHVGHSFEDNMVVDLDWQPDESDPWCIASLSENMGAGGSTLQIWRMSDLLYRPRHIVIAELRRYESRKRN